jgi:hypothetical protein
MLPKGKIFATLEFNYEVLSEERIKNGHIRKALQKMEIPDVIYEDVKKKYNPQRWGEYTELPLKLKITYNNKVISHAVALSRIGNVDPIANVQREIAYQKEKTIIRRKKNIQFFPSRRRPELRPFEKEKILKMYSEVNLGIDAIAKAMNIEPKIIRKYIESLGIMRSRNAPIKPTRVKLKEKD